MIDKDGLIPAGYTADFTLHVPRTPGEVGSVLVHCEECGAVVLLTYTVDFHTGKIVNVDGRNMSIHSRWHMLATRS